MVEGVTNLYAVLGLDRDRGISRDDIKKAYRKLSHKYHPDGREPDEAKFRKINEAYEVLQDPVRRQHYDATGETGSVDSEQEKIDDYLTSLFSDAVSQLKNSTLAGRDLIQLAKDDISAAIEELEQQISNTMVAIEALEMLKGRVLYRGERGDNLFTAVLEGEISSMNSGVTGGRQQIELLKKVYDALGYYTDQVAAAASCPHGYEFIGPGGQLK